MTFRLGGLILALFVSTAYGQAPAQPEGPPRTAPRENYAAGKQSTANMQLQFHLPLFSASDIRVEQELSRPFVFQAHGRPAGLHVLNVREPSRASVIYSWTIENPDVHAGGASGVMLVKHRGRYYALLSVQFGQQGPDADVVAIVFDVTSLPDTSKVREVARIRNGLQK